MESGTGVNLWLGFGCLSEMMAPMNLKVANVLASVISFVFSALNSMPYAVDVLSSRRSMSYASSCSLPARPSVSSANCRLLVLRPAMLINPTCSTSASGKSLSHEERLPNENHGLSQACVIAL